MLSYFQSHSASNLLIYQDSRCDYINIVWVQLEQLLARHCGSVWVDFNRISYSRIAGDIHPQTQEIIEELMTKLKDFILVCSDTSHKTTITQVGLDDDIVDSRHDKLDLSGIRSTSEVSVDLLLVGLIQ